VLSPAEATEVVEPLDLAGLHEAVAELARRDADLAAIVGRYGPPPLWDREPGFPTLLHIVLEQQVSLASARAAFDRLLAAADPLTPAALLRLSDDQLLAIGFSRQKARYGRAIAAAVEDGSLDLEGLVRLPDAGVVSALESMPGIGPWTSSIYLLMVLGRLDVWPVADIALAESVRAVKGLHRRPDRDEMTRIGESWRPLRSVAARLLWHDYLARRGRTG